MSNVRAAILQELLAEEESAIARLQEQVQLAREEIGARERVAVMLRSRLDFAKPTETSHAQTNGASNTTGENWSPQEAPEPSTLADRLVAILRKEKRPMRLMDLAEHAFPPAATEEIRAGNQSTVATSLSRRKELFFRVSRGLYRLREPEDGEASGERASE